MKTSISLADKQYFNLSIGKRILKSHIFGNKIGIPVYSANVFKPFGFVKKSNITDFTKDYIIWGIDGNFNFNVITQGTSFATTDHCGVIDIKDKQIHPKYILFQLKMKIHQLGFNRAIRASLNNMRQVSVDVPIKQNGEFDLEQQKTIAEKYERIDMIKNALYEVVENVENIQVTVPFNGDMKNISLGNEKVFFVDTGERITKTDIVKSQGIIPVYSGSKNKDEPMGFVSDDVKKIVPKAKKYKGKYLTVNANGSVGKVFLRNEEFYLHDDVNIIQILDKNILYEYLLYELQNKIDVYGYGVWTKKLYKTELKEVVSVDIPIKQNGEFDMERQRMIAEKYERIEVIKNQITELVSPLIETDIEF